MKTRILFVTVFILSHLGAFSHGFAQQLIQDEFVTYSKNSSFIKEFKVPIDDFGLKGITTDTSDNVWFYHSTSKTSGIFKFVPETGKFTKYEVDKTTQTTDSITNLSGGQLIYDKNRNVIWFTDARTNSIGKLNVESGNIKLYNIPTKDAGPMGLVLSHDNNTLWFAELNGNTISSLDILSGKITEYPLQENSGPTLVAFDKDGFLWVTMSYSNSVLKINLEELVSGSQLSIMELKLPKGDVFSPFGIVIISNNDNDKLVISDHGSSRVIISDVVSNLNQYSSYWTSESFQYPQTLPGQIVSDESGNVYFPQHGGNKISKLDTVTGIITEYDIPTGPLSTVVYVTLDQNEKIWFTEVLANRIGYLDTSIPIPIHVTTSEKSIILHGTNNNDLDMWIEKGHEESPILTKDIQISLAGMTHSGIKGISYDIVPEIISLNGIDKTHSKINISAQDTAKSGLYNIMLQITAKERADKELKVSILQPLDVSVEIKDTKTDNKQSSQSDVISGTTIKDIIQAVALSVAVALSALIILRRVKLRISKNH